MRTTDRIFNAAPKAEATPSRRFTLMLGSLLSVCRSRLGYRGTNRLSDLNDRQLRDIGMTPREHGFHQWDLEVWKGIDPRLDVSTRDRRR